MKPDRTKTIGQNRECIEAGHCRCGTAPKTTASGGAVDTKAASISTLGSPPSRTPGLRKTDGARSTVRERVSSSFAPCANGTTSSVGTSAASALKALEEVPRVADEPRVFAGYRKRQLAEMNDKVFASLRPRSKPRHAMRDIAATGMAAAGVRIEDVSRVLNQRVGLRVTAGYNAYAYDREKRIALSAWAHELARILA